MLSKLETNMADNYLISAVSKNAKSCMFYELFARLVNKGLFLVETHSDDLSTIRCSFRGSTTQFFGEEKLWI